MTVLIIVPDSNILYFDPFLERPRIRTILAAESQGDLRLAVPAVVLDELRNQVKDKLNKTIANVDKARQNLAELKGLFGFNSYQVDLSIDAEQRRAVMERFDHRREQLDAEQRILSYPSASTEELSHRSIQGRRPFKPNDRGLRDTIVWLSVKEYLLQQSAGTSPKILLLSEDEAFWNDSKTGLHKDLIEDLRLEGIPEGSVIIRKNLNEVISEFIAGRLSSVEWVKVAIEGGQVPDFTYSSDAIDILANEWLSENSEIFEDAPYIPSDYPYMNFDVLENMDCEHIDSPLGIGNDLVAVNSVWSGEATVQGVVADLGEILMEDTLDVALEINIASILKVKNGGLCVQSHEISHIEPIEIRKR